MNKWMVSLVIVSLLSVGILVIYEEAFSRPMLCDTMEQMCVYCGGSWDLYWCETYDQNGNGLIDCLFCCYGVYNPEYPYGWPCEWPTGNLCGMCVQ